MTERQVDACVPVDISDEDVYEAMKEIPGYLDITPGDFKEVYLKAYQHAMRRLISSITAADVMTRQVTSVGRETSLKEVAELMAAKRISGVPVVEGEQTVVGIVSERDFLGSMGAGRESTFMEVVAQCLQGKGCLAVPIRAKTAGDIMSSPPVTVTEQTSVIETAQIMSEWKINRVPVLDGAGRMVGIVSRADVVGSSPVGRL